MFLKNLIRLEGCFNTMLTVFMTSRLLVSKKRFLNILNYIFTTKL